MSDTAEERALQRPKRRTVAAGMAWAAPVVLAGRAAPAVAASAPLAMSLTQTRNASYTECGDYCYLYPDRCPPFTGVGALLDVFETPYHPARGYSFAYTARATVDTGVITRVWGGHVGGNCWGDFPGPTLNVTTTTVEGIAMDRGNHMYSNYFIFETQGATAITVDVSTPDRGHIVQALPLAP